MKLPAKPPNGPRFTLPDREDWSHILAEVKSPLVKGEYVHWDQLLHLPPPAGLTHQEWWRGLKFLRHGQKKVDLRDKEGKGFYFLEPEPIPEALHKIDMSAGGRIEMPDQITNPETKDRYLISSLIEEAITSSQLEGAATTRLVAKAMLRENRPPSDRNEQMILNNYLTMRLLTELKDRALSPELVFEIHRRLTTGTHDDASIGGRFRRADERILVGDSYGQIYHEPPAAGELAQRLAAMCDFANGNTPAGFIHPLIRSIILHFWLAYDHPFVDGNGRTARALFYWSMLHHGYWLFEFISISRILLKTPSQYARAFLYTETDENDLTYFVLYQIDVIKRAIRELHEYIGRKTQEIQTLEQNMRGLVILNPRQRALIGHALRHPQFRYTFRSHQGSHNVVYQTARTDILALVKKGLLEEQKIGKTCYFIPAQGLEKKLEALA